MRKLEDYDIMTIMSTLEELSEGNYFIVQCFHLEKARAE